MIPIDVAFMAMLDGIENVRNFGLACHTWATSHNLQKIANDFPKLSRRIHGYAKRLQAASKEILCLSSTLMRLSLEEEDESFIQVLLAVQLALH